MSYGLQKNTEIYKSQDIGYEIFQKIQGDPMVFSAGFSDLVYMA